MGQEQSEIGPVTEADIEQLISLDRRLSGGDRVDFFRKRYQAMTQGPSNYLGLVARSGDAVCGFLLAHIQHGEFGDARPIAVLDAIGVERDQQGLGIGDQLVQTLKDAARQHGCGEVRTQVSWTQQDLLAYFAGTGFQLAPRVVLAKTCG